MCGSGVREGEGEGRHVMGGEIECRDLVRMKRNRDDTECLMKSLPLDGEWMKRKKEKKGGNRAWERDRAVLTLALPHNYCGRLEYWEVEVKRSRRLARLGEVKLKSLTVSEIALRTLKRT